jgi:hypothetical protein
VAPPQPLSLRQKLQNRFVSYTRVLILKSLSNNLVLLCAGNNVFLDVQVSGCPIAVNISQRDNNIVMLDANFTLPTGGTGFNVYAMDANETGIALSRVTVSGGAYAVRGPTAETTVAQASSGSTKLSAWRTGGYEYVNDHEQQQGAVGGGGPLVFGQLKSTRPDTALPLRPKPRVQSAFNVLDAGAVGDCKHDDTEAIKRSLAAHDTVFLPATSGQNGGGPQEGCYLISDTLTLRSNATLLGAYYYVLLTFAVTPKNQHLICQDRLRRHTHKY